MQFVKTASQQPPDSMRDVEILTTLLDLGTAQLAGAKSLFFACFTTVHFWELHWELVAQERIV